MSSSAPIRRRLLLGAATNWLAFAATLLSAFFLAPYLIAKLGDARYGVWVFVESILAYFTLFDLGVASCLVRFVARHHAQRDQDELNRTFSACLNIFLVAAAVGLVIALALVPILAPVLADKAPEATDTSAFLVVMFLTIAATLPLSAFPSVLDGLERYTIKSAVRITFLVIRIVGFVWVCETQTGLLPLGIVYAVTQIAEFMTCGLLAHRALPGLRFAPRSVDRVTLRKVRGYSVDAFLAMIAGRVSFQSASIVIGLTLLASQVTYFALAFRLAEMAKMMLRHVTTTLTPAISSLEASGDHEAIRRIVLTATRWVLYLILPIQVGMWFFGRAFFNQWLGDSIYGQRCFPVLAILAGGLGFAMAQSVCARVLYGTGRLRLFSRLLLVEAGVILMLSLLLVRPLGIVGVAIAITVPNAIGCIVVIGYTCRTLAIPISEYLRLGWLRPSLLVIFPTLIWAVVIVPNALVGWGTIIATGLVGVIPYALVVASTEGVWTKAMRRFRPQLVGPVVGTQV